MSKVFCLILNYNRQADTVKCARSILASKLPSGAVLVIIDNGPKDSKAYFKKRVPSAIYLKSPNNRGFSAGNNIGIKYALENRASHILIINPDTIVPRDFLIPLLSTFRETPGRVGLLAPALTQGRGVYSLGGRIDWTIASFSHDDVTQLPHYVLEYDFLTFACVLIKREVFESVGLMDERYFLYLEDVDYCVAASKKGFKLELNPRVIVAHSVSSSFANLRDKIGYSFISCLKFIFKWYRFPKSIVPILHALYLYPYTYILWTLQSWKHKLLN